MLSVSVGPFVLALSHLLLLMALALATLVGWFSGRRQRVNPERVLFSLFLASMLVARLAFVVAYWPQYHDHWLSVLDIRDGGFLVWPGVSALLIGAVAYGLKRPTLRTSLGLGIVSGLLFWALTGLVLTAQHANASLPDLTLHNAEGEPVQLSDYRGKSLVINLWATWCPPCRREMPVLASAQQNNPDVTVLFVNQAESARDVATFLASEGLHLNNVFFDNNGALAERVGSAGLPTTLFYSSQGHLSGSHMGELSSASLKHALDTLSEAAALSPSRSHQ